MGEVVALCKILNVRGYKETMLSAIKCVGEVDAGPIYLKKNEFRMVMLEDIF